VKPRAEVGPAKSPDGSNQFEHEERAENQADDAENVDCRVPVRTGHTVFAGEQIENEVFGLLLNHILPIDCWLRARTYLERWH
jgi:hypothetical protein